MGREGLVCWAWNWCKSSAMIWLRAGISLVPLGILLSSYGHCTLEHITTQSAVGYQNRTIHPRFRDCRTEWSGYFLRQVKFCLQGSMIHGLWSQDLTMSQQFCRSKILLYNLQLAMTQRQEEQINIEKETQSLITAEHE